MIPVMLITQEGQISDEIEQNLKAEISVLVQNEFAADADIDWIEVPAGRGFTGAKASTAVIASLHANRCLAYQEREALLKKLGGICTRLTGLSFDEIITAVRDPR